MIVSRQNALIKNIRSLFDKKNRDDQGLYLVESVKLVNEAVKSQDVTLLLGTEKGISQINGYTGRVETVSDGIFEYVSAEKTPQGVLAIVKKPQSVTAEGGNCLFLDGVSDPNNVGAIIRTCACAGYRDVYLSNCADAYSPKTVRASMGGIFRVNIFSGDREELYEKVKEKQIIIADMGGNNVFTTRIDGEFCLVLGNEGNGVSDFMKSRANKTVSIPMNNEMESLNVSVSAGILMYNLIKND